MRHEFFDNAGNGMKDHVRSAAIAIAILAGALSANASTYDVNFSSSGFNDDNPSTRLTTQIGGLTCVSDI